MKQSSHRTNVSLIGNELLEHEMLLCMIDLENKELNDSNVNSFFDNISSLLELSKLNQKKNDANLRISVNKLNKQTEIHWEYNPMHLYYQNVRNLKNKNHVIKPKTYTIEYDIIALTETFFDSGNINEEYFSDKFCVFRCDRSTENSAKMSGGGTLIAIKKNENYEIEKIDLDKFSDIELVGSKIKLNNGNLIFVFCVYIPPDRAHDPCVFTNLTNAIKSMAMKSNDIIILTGDLNLPKIRYDFNNNDKLVASNFKPNFTADLFYELTALGLRQINYVKNYKQNVLDLIFINDELDCELREIKKNPLVKIDAPHPPIECTIYNILPKMQINDKNNRIGTMHDFKRTDFVAMNKYFGDIDLGNVLMNMNVEKSFECFYNTISCSFSQFVPKIKIRPKQTKPWYNIELKKLRNCRNKEHKKMINGLAHDYDNKKNEFEKLNKELYDKYIEQTANKIKTDPKQFWSYVNGQKKSKGFETTMKYKNDMAKNDSDIANLFAKFFSSVFCGERNEQEIRQIENKLENSQIHITVKEVAETMKNFPMNKGIGTDNFPPIVIKNCVSTLAKPIAVLFNKSILDGVLPTSLKTSHITPIYKKGSKQNVENYRSIATMPSLLKLFEKIMLNKIMSHFGPLLNPSQHGFVTGKSVNTNLMELVTLANESFAEKCQIDVLYTDFSKAFDKVDHALLLNKMFELNFDHGLIKWVASYLYNRIMKVTVNNSFSKIYKMNTGVPAGSILGPILFLIYINDLPSIFENSCHVLMFADDCKLIMKIKSMIDAIKFQTEIDKLQNWCEDNKLEINCSKCAILTLTKLDRTITKAYTMNNVIVNRVNVYRDLGIMIDKNLTFKNHIESLISSCNSTMGFIKRTVGRKFDTGTIVVLYNSLVRSKLLFGIVIWYPYSQTGREIVESTQKKFTMMALNEWPNAQNNYRIRPYSDRCNDLKIDSIYNRYEAACCTFVVDVMLGKLDSEYLSRKLRWNTNRQTRGSNMIYVPTFRIEYLQSQSLWSAVNIFNNSKLEFENSISRNNYIKLLKKRNLYLL